MSEHPILGLKEQDEFPCEIDAILTSVRWEAMQDFQRGWYWQLILKMNRSKPLGYLPFDGQLWELAGARTRQYFDKESAVVLACFKSCEFDGRKWIYHEKLLAKLCQLTYSHDRAVSSGRRGGHAKQTRSTRPSNGINKYSLEFETIWQNNTWKCLAKPQANRAFEKALQHIQQEKKCARDQAIAILADAMEEFKNSPAGKANGMFEGYSSPYPASWLNAERYFDDRRFWRPGRANGNGPTPPAHKASFAKAECPTCSGSGWDTSTGKAKRCACFEQNRAARAASGAAT